MARPYIPERGDLVWLQFSPQSGHEKAGNRPALVLSPQTYNRRVGLAVFCPVTSRVKGYPFEVLLPASCKLQGAVLADQVKSLDWRARKAKRISRVPGAVVDEVSSKLLALTAPD